MFRHDFCLDPARIRERFLYKICFSMSQLHFPCLNFSLPSSKFRRYTPVKSVGQRTLKPFFFQTDSRQTHRAIWQKLTGDVLPTHSTMHLSALPALVARALAWKLALRRLAPVVTPPLQCPARPV